MHVLLRFSAALAAAYSLSCTVPAAASGIGTVTISDVQLSVFDLVPDDGIAAGYEIDASASFLNSLISVQGSETTDDVMLPLGQPGSARVDRGPSYVTSRTNGALGDVTTVVDARSNLNDHGSAHGYAGQYLSLTLRPGTVLMVAGHFIAQSDAMTDNGKYSVSSTVTVDIGDGELDVVSSFQKTAYAPPTGDAHMALNEDFAVAYANGTGQDLAVNLNMSGQAFISVLPLVPEPGAWMMLAAGLALLGAARARRMGGRFLQLPCRS